MTPRPVMAQLLPQAAATRARCRRRALFERTDRALVASVNYWAKELGHG